MEQSKKYNVIYADPPWEYRHKVTGRGGRGAASHHYETMPLEEIKNLIVPADKNCFLWLWVTNPILAEGWHTEVCRAWGFKPQTILTWVKKGIGMGYTLRSATEHILVARKGKPVVNNRSVPTWFEAKRLRHSEKPEEARRIIEKICAGPYLEMFARKQTEGWDVFGDEVGSSIELMQHTGASPMSVHNDKNPDKQKQ